MMGSFFSDVASVDVLKNVEKFQNRFFTEYLRLTPSGYCYKIVQIIKIKSNTSLQWVNVRGKCLNTEFFLVRIFPYFATLRILSEYRNIRTRKNSIFGLFPRSVTFFNESLLSWRFLNGTEFSWIYSAPESTWNRFCSNKNPMVKWNHSWNKI